MNFKRLTLEFTHFLFFFNKDETDFMHGSYSPEVWTPRSSQSLTAVGSDCRGSHGVTEVEVAVFSPIYLAWSDASATGMPSCRTSFLPDKAGIFSPGNIMPTRFSGSTA